jgi:hypothetical protein
LARRNRDHHRQTRERRIARQIDVLVRGRSARQMDLHNDGLPADSLLRNKTEGRHVGCAGGTIRVRSQLPDSIVCRIRDKHAAEGGSCEPMRLVQLRLRCFAAVSGKTQYSSSSDWIQAAIGI